MLTATYKLCEKSLGWVVSNLYRIVSPYVACNFYIKQCNLERTNIATLPFLPFFFFFPFFDCEQDEVGRTHIQ